MQMRTSSSSPGAWLNAYSFKFAVALVFTIFVYGRGAAPASAQMTNGKVSLVANKNGNFEVTWEGLTDLPVNVERKSAMWQEWQVVSTYNTTRRYVDMSPPSERGFYRLAIPATISVSPNQHWDSWLIFPNYEQNLHLIQVTVANTGPGPLVVKGVNRTLSATSGFGYSLPDAPVMIPAGQSSILNIWVHVAYAYGGVYDEISLVSNATSGSGTIVVQGYTIWDPSNFYNPGGPIYP